MFARCSCTFYFLRLPRQALKNLAFARASCTCKYLLEEHPAFIQVAGNSVTLEIPKPLCFAGLASDKFSCPMDPTVGRDTKATASDIATTGGTGGGMAAVA